MFDVFDIALPRLRTESPFEVHKIQSAFGQSDERLVYFDGHRVGRAYVQSSGFRLLNRIDQVMLRIADGANVAARDDQSWMNLLKGIEDVLCQSSDWQVTCESDCEQYPLETLVLSPQQLVLRLDSYRKAPARPMAFSAAGYGHHFRT